MKPTAALLIAALAVAGCQQSIAGRPPLRFQADGSAVVFFVDPRKVDAVCKQRGGRPPAGARIGACAGSGLITMPNPCLWPRTNDYAGILCHELGHVNGWAADHPSDPPA